MMLNVLREFGVKLSLISDSKELVNFNKGVDSAISGLKGLGLQASAVAGSIFGLAKATASNAFDLELQSQKFGISTERLQEFAYAAKVTADVSRDELMGAFEGLSGTLDNVRKGNVDAAMAFNRLGLSSDILTNRNLRADQVMGMVADRLKGIKDPIARAAIANEIFGASGAKMLPMLLKGSEGMAKYGQEARALGVVFSEGQIKRQAKFQESFTKTMELVKHVGLVVGEMLLPVVQQVFNDFNKWVLANKQLIATGLKEFILGAADGLKLMWKVGMLVWSGFTKFTVAIGGAKNAAKLLFGAFAAFQALKLLPLVGSLISGFASLGTHIWTVTSFLGGIAKGAAVASISGLVTALKTLFALGNLKAGFTWLVTVGPTILAVTAGAGSLLAIIQSIWTLLTGGNIEDTWLAKAGDWITEKVPQLNVGGKIHDFFSKRFGADADLAAQGFKINAGPVNSYKSAASSGATASASNVANSNRQENKIQQNITVQVPPGTSAGAATKIVSDGTHDGMERILRTTRDQALGGRRQ